MYTHWQNVKKTVYKWSQRHIDLTQNSLSISKSLNRSGDKSLADIICRLAENVYLTYNVENKIYTHFYLAYTNFATDRFKLWNKLTRSPLICAQKYCILILEYKYKNFVLT